MSALVMGIVLILAFILSHVFKISLLIAGLLVLIGYVGGWIAKGVANK